MDKIQGRTFTAERAWEGPTLAHIPNALVKLRWTDVPYRWHRNEGSEVFVVLDGTLDMHVRRPGQEARVIPMGPGEMLAFRDGDEHVAHPHGPVRLLIIEQADSE